MTFLRLRNNNLSNHTQNHNEHTRYIAEWIQGGWSLRDRAKRNHVLCEGSVLHFPTKEEALAAARDYNKMDSIPPARRMWIVEGEQPRGWF